MPPAPASLEADPSASAAPLTVIKLGGGLAGVPDGLARAAAIVAGLVATRRVVVVPGGGPFADRVREFERTHRLSPTAAHWMAILGMDQYAWALAERLPGGIIVEDGAGIAAAHAGGRLPVLAPARWLRAADELPHSWEVTSDSLAAYLAMLLGADELVLVKPVAGGRELLDPWFDRVLPAGLAWRVIGIGP